MSPEEHNPVFYTILLFPTGRVSASEINIPGIVLYRLFGESANDFGRDMEKEDRANERERKNEDNEWVYPKTGRIVGIEFEHRVG